MNDQNKCLVCTKNFISQHMTNMSDRTIRELKDELLKSASDCGIISKLCKKWEAIDFNEVMENAAENGHIEIVKLLKEYGATNFNWPMINAAENGHNEIVKLLEEWDAATNFNWAMAPAA